MGVQFTVEHNKTSYRWPVNATIYKKDRRGRRDSISAIDLQAHRDAIEAERLKVEAEKKAAAQKLTAAKSLATFDTVWTKFLADNKLTNDHKYNKQQSEKFRSGKSVLWIHTTRTNVKYFAAEGAICACNQAGERQPA